MTTIATDGVAIASDGRTTAGNQVVTDKATKLFRLPDGSVVGESGTCTASILAVDELSDAIREDRHPKRMGGDYTLLRLGADGKATVYWGELVGVEVPTPMAVGSGSEFALGAMHHGACAQEAVRIAKKLDRNSGGRVQTLIPRNGS